MCHNWWAISTANEVNPERWMMHEVLVELVVVMAGSVLAALLLRKLRLPPVVGFILVGILVGPGGLRLVTNRHTIEVVAEVGVMLLLFTVGLKIKLSDLWRMKGTVFGSGTLQVVATGAVAAGVALALGRPWVEAVVWASWPTTSARGSWLVWRPTPPCTC